jgi:hypothetical protein
MNLLKHGDTIGIISPSWVANQNDYEKYAKGINKLGFHVKFGKNIYKDTYKYTASVAERVDDLNQMIYDENVRLVFFGGGYGSVDLLPYIDYNRITLLMAVLEKRAGFNLGAQDVYVNIVGGMKVNEPAIDLGIIVAVASSFKNVSISEDLVVIGEVGLTGEVRSVNMIEKRIKEAEKLGYKTCIIPESNKKLLKEKFKLDIIGTKNIIDVMKYLKIK